MTLSIALSEKQFSSVIEQRDAKLIYANKVHTWFSPFFTAKRLEVWKNATDEAIGGEKLDTLPISREAPFLDSATKAVLRKGVAIDNLILLVRGVWEDERNKLPAYLSVNLQPRWADVYGTIEMNVFASGDIDDIVQPIWAAEDIRAGLVENFTKEFSEYYDKAIGTDSIVYAVGVPSQVSVKMWKASYYKNPNFYLQKFISSLQSDFPDLKPYLRMINHSVLAADLYGATFFTDIVENKGQASGVSVDYSNSISLIGTKPDSYENMYQELSKSVFQILSKSLEPDKEIDKRISTQVAKEAGFDIDSLRSKDSPSS